MHEYTQDAMVYVRNYFLIRLHATPMTGQVHTHRHDLTARVFRRKLIRLMDSINQHKIFGETQCWLYSIEWQKRGLPHAHILIWLNEKIMAPQIDDIILLHELL